MIHKWGKVGLRQWNREHRPCTQRLHEASTLCHQAQCINQGKHPRDGRCNVLTEAMPDHRLRMQPPRGPQLRQRILNHEQRRLWTSWRSEEHTSELQSQSNLVCRLLLEKKKNIYYEMCSLQCLARVILVACSR